MEDPRKIGRFAAADCHRTIVEETADMVFTIDREGCVLDVNPAAARAAGRSRESIVGVHLTGIFPPEMAAEHLREINGVFETGRGRRTLRVSTFPGGSRWLDTDLFPVRDAAGTVVAVVGVSRDVTARERAEAALREEKERLAVTLASLDEGVITTDTSGRITSLNPVAARLTGWTGGEALGTEIERAYHVVDNSSGMPLESEVRRVLAGREPGAVPRIDKVLVGRDGQETRVDDNCAPLRRADGEILGAVLVFRDIGRQRALEEEMRRKEKLDSIGVLAGGIAHDFNNILMVMLGNLNIARRRAAGNRQVAELLAEAETAVFRARDLTNQLLTFSRGGAPVKSRIDLRTVVDDAARFALSGTGRECRRTFAPDTWHVEADPTQIGQVVQNLVLNAHQATAGPEPVEVSVRNLSLAEAAELSLEGERHVCIVVTDRGAGMGPEVLARIFDPYFSTRSGGTGLGLPTALSIIERHGGRLTVESRPGEGSRFLVVLPAPTLKVREAGGSLTPPRGTAAAVRGRALLLDDDPAVLDVAARMLEELGYRVTAMADGREAVAAYRLVREAGAAFDVAILDVNIPGGMGGCEAARLIRDLHPAARLLVSSGYSEDPVMAEWAAHGFDGALAKPYEMDRLDRVLRGLRGNADLRGATSGEGAR
jgi:PAS domain S-box-containing protein